MKFKLGDRVRVTEDEACASSFSKDYVGTITKLETDIDVVLRRPIFRYYIDEGCFVTEEYLDYADEQLKEKFKEDTTLTKREMFAMAAMQGVLNVMSSEITMLAFERAAQNDKIKTAEYITQKAVKLADALILELAKEKKNDF